MLMEQLQQERLCIAVASIASCRRALADTLDYVKQRTAFGKRIAAFQNTQFKLVELATEVEVGQAFVDKLLAAHVRGDDIVTEVSMAKFWTTDLQKRLTSECLQLHGGYGFMLEYPISGDYADAAVQSIYAGSERDHEGDRGAPARPRLSAPRGAALAAALAAWLAAGGAGAALRAEQISEATAAELLIGGPDAIGGVGDWYLANDVVEVIVDDPARRFGKRNHGGVIVDAGLRDRRGEDQFAELFPLLNLDQRVELRFDRIRAEVDPGGAWARLVVSGSRGPGAIARGGWLARGFDPLVPERRRDRRRADRDRVRRLPRRAVGAHHHHDPQPGQRARRRSSPMATC